MVVIDLFSQTFHAVSDSLTCVLFFVRCGQETRVIPRILQLRSHWLKSEKESLRLEEAGITKEVWYCLLCQCSCCLLTAVQQFLVSQ